MMPVLAWEREAAGFYADIRHQLSHEGLPIGDAVIIAAQALAVGAVLMTNNVRHFGRVAGGLVVENWEDSGWSWVILKGFLISEVRRAVLGL